MNLTECRVCPLECGADRTKTRGSCGAKDLLEISSWNLHFGEEPPISGFRGSGTVFFTHCSMKCCFCQNYPISHLGHGREYTEQDFIKIMLELRDQGAHNINLVTPTHYSPQIKSALDKMRGKLKIPVVYNCSGYEKVETLRELEGLIDLYMPDAKFSDNEAASKICNAKDYWDVNRRALKEMRRQVGDLKLDKQGIAQRGLLIRHLVLPDGLSGTEEVLRFIAREISPDTYVSLMSQYHPAHRGVGDKVLGRRLTQQEYDSAAGYSRKYGLNNCYYQWL
jgi:putative pyruvate formate lyase activating enzyme